MTDTLWLVYLTVIGAALGSFLNVCIYRWPAGESVVRPRSRCPRCGQALRWYDNIPILSWLILRGRCRTCREGVSVQYPLVEAVVAAIWLGMGLWLGPGLEAVRGALFFTILLGIAIIDARHRIIPDQLSLGGAVVGLALAGWSADMSLQVAAIGAGVGYGFMWLVKWGGEALFRKPALGVGDIHMMAMIGAFVGLGGALLTIFLGSLLGLLIGVPLAAARGKLEAMGTYVPLGTFLAMGAAVTYIWGDLMIQLYLGYAMPG
jgi:leader peptidase (prepilin peptidase) / N-methyltransferase